MTVVADSVYNVSVRAATIAGPGLWSEEKISPSVKGKNITCRYMVRVMGHQ